MSELRFDAIVLGAGPAGEVCAGRLADAGWSVAIVERDLLGGECSYYACMPSKALLRPADVLAEARRVPGVPVGEASALDPAAILARRDEVIHDRDDSGHLPWLEERGIALHRGTGRFLGERRVGVGDEVLIAERAVIVATGSGAAMPPIDGLDTVSPWNNRDATTATEVPASMIVLGGGPVGSELSQAWSSLGTKVTLIEGNEHLLGRDEPFAGEEVAAALRERFGVDVRTGTLAARVRSGAGVAVELKDGGTVEGEQLLVAIGRKPHTAELDLEQIGVEPDEHGFLATDERLRVAGSEWLHAIGDVNGRALFTHVGKYQAWIVAENLLGRPVAALAEALGSPRVTFTDPQVAAVGKTFQQALDAGLDARAVDVPTDGSPGASFQGKDTGGTSRLVVDQGKQTIVGATFSGFETADFLHAATIAIVAEVPLPRLRHALAAYPARSEVWLKLIEEWEAGD
jgi:pyruvate/2-oxoglutarate dehydrogenase complex dihydrolipoamide dehydrogenase (E3) component